MAKRGWPRIRAEYAVEGQRVVHRSRLGRVRAAQRDEVAEVAWVVNGGLVTDQAYLLLAAEDRGLVAVPAQEVAASGVLDWCKALPGWSFDRFAAAQADTGNSYRTVWTRGVEPS